MSRKIRRPFLLALLVALPILAIASRSAVLERFRGPDPEITLRVVLSERTLQVIEDGEVEETYGIAIGTPSHPTPTGSFRTGRIDWDPAWVPPPSEWARNLKPRAAGDPRNPMQGVKIFFSEPYYFIHGTNDPASIGSAASHGCIRMRAEDAKDLAETISEYGSVLMVIEP